MILRKKIFWINFIAMALIAINLRAPITSIGPITESVKQYFMMNSALVGFLTSLPLIAFGIFSFLVAKFQQTQAMIVGLICIVVGELLRGYAPYAINLIGFQNLDIIRELNIYLLFIGTTIMGAGIAIANVLLPSFIKAKFPNNIPKIMGFYGLVLNFSAIIGIALALPLLRNVGLINAMSFWVLLAILALIVYIPQIKNGRLTRRILINDKKFNIFSSIDAWKITIFMGLQSFLFYGLIVWFPQIIVEKGYSIEFSTNITLVAQFVAFPIALIGPILLTHLRAKYKPFYMACLCSLYVIGLLLLFFINDSFLLYIVACIIGMPMGGAFSIALLFISQKSTNVFISVKLSAMAQGFGYLIASLSPFLIGKMHDVFHGFNEGIIMFIFAGIALCLFGVLAYHMHPISNK